MQPVLRKSCLIVVAFIVTAALLSATAAAAKDKYILALCLKSSAGIDGQYKAVFTDVAKAFTQETGVELQVKHYNEIDKFVADVNKNLIDIAFTTDMVTRYELTKQNKLIPFVSVKMFGQKGYRVCMYVKKGKSFKNISDLRNKIVLTYNDSPDAYYSLTKLTGETPDKYYTLKASPNAFSMIYALSLDDADAAFINEFNIEYFKMTNPGPVKDVAPIVCGEEILNWPVLKSPKAPAALTDAVQDFMVDMNKRNSLKKYAPLLKQMKMSYYPVTAEDYKSYIELMDNGKKQGWKNNYDNWIKYQKIE